jgi:hypothetical protein
MGIISALPKLFYFGQYLNHKTINNKGFNGFSVGITILTTNYILTSKLFKNFIIKADFLQWLKFSFIQDQHIAY